VGSGAGMKRTKNKEIPHWKTWKARRFGSMVLLCVLVVGLFGVAALNGTKYAYLLGWDRSSVERGVCGSGSGGWGRRLE
jgi:hypothetical protein